MAQQSVGDLVVSLDVDAARFKEQLGYARQQLGGLGNAANDASVRSQQAFSKQEIAAHKAGLSVGQYSNAMRMLPAQFTDIATQLAGGQSPWLILLQQGGQIKDSFGGLRPTFSALLGSISPVLVGVGALTAATGAMIYAYYQGSSTLSDFTKTLVLSGNTAGLTAGGMLSIAASAERANITFGQASETLTALINAGVSAGSRFDLMTVAVSRFTEASGVPVDKVAAAFGKLSNDPTSGLIAMAQQFHTVTAEQINYVASLQRAGDEAAALQAANEIATGGFEKQTLTIEQNMGTIEKSANALSRAFKSMWDAALDIGRPDTGSEMLKKAQDAFNNAERIWNLRKNDSFVNDDARARYWDDRENARVALDMAQQQAANSQVTADNATREASAEADKQKYAAQAQRNYVSTLTALEKYTARQKELNGALSEGRILQADYNINMAVAKKEYEDALKKQPKPKETRISAGVRTVDRSNKETLELETQLKVLQQHAGVNDTISQQRKSLWAMQSRFTVLEESARNRVLSKEEQSLLANKNLLLAQGEINAALGDQIVSQEQLNKLQDTSQKYVTQMQEKTSALSSSSGLSSRIASRQLEEAQLRQGWRNQGGSLLDKGYQSELQALRVYYAEQDKLRNDWQAGAKTSLANFSEEVTSYNQLAADATTSILSGATSSIAEGLSGMISQTKSMGDAFENMFIGMGQSVIQMLSQMAAQWLVYQAVQLIVGKSGQASAAAGMISNAQASSLMAQLNAYASTAAIPIVGPTLAPAAMASAAAITLPLVAAISASSLAGMAHDGIDNVPATGTWLLQKGERVTTAQTSAKLDATLGAIQQQREATGGKFNFSSTIQVNGDPDQRTLQMLESAVQRGAQQGYALMVNDLAKGQGKVSKAIGAGWNTKRRTR
ncbi:phage tail length tape measure family protein [Yersinia intermedia]|uniref:phage tail tape measure protein n=1 Tax=Yersinia intermedia TaxID=631 RepID=UPI0022FF2D5F|nr:phage tail length tape measure family protein [Yersinia intermedia]MDA5495388.1 phage tail length tape measure family protein [Yersinia intermedia]